MAEGEAAVKERDAERAEKAKPSPGFCEAAPIPIAFSALRLSRQASAVLYMVTNLPQARSASAMS
jgi:hypothetical protein